ncbi:MAG: molybdopterin-guanine dinucleotide biosynthesis protein B [Metallosphaera yellowstonensis]|jgi:molybdopterin-guanine dinucleotide biosynthesis protein B|uniref:Molybdopterin-guanine dinucleotide biosynthesis protein MobB n=1 Tax=Metallosphaera yellowstonensis MK1 TaxID=671065 RepID=H2C949_9CREN|nr:molybdopterin-guanine dinucleotide biosynthesis protein MobB [Metallosphaera yellowstonensis MK1]
MNCVYQVVGRKDSGKTLTIEIAARKLKEMGYTVAVVKHTHHVINPDSKDTARFMRSGADVVILHSNDCMWFWECKETEYLDLIPADVVLIEGFESVNLGNKFVIERPEDAESIAREIVNRAESCSSDIPLMIRGVNPEKRKKLIFYKLMKKWGVKEVKLLET